MPKRYRGTIVNQLVRQKTKIDASIGPTFDQVREITHDEAFQMLGKMKNIPLLLDHKHDLPIGKVLNAYITADDKFDVEFELNEDDKLVQQQLDSQNITGLSLSHYKQSLEPVEVSLCHIGARPYTRVDFSDQPEPFQFKTVDNDVLVEASIDPKLWQPLNQFPIMTDQPEQQQQQQPPQEQHSASESSVPIDMDPEKVMKSLRKIHQGQDLLKEDKLRICNSMNTTLEQLENMRLEHEELKKKYSAADQKAKSLHDKNKDFQKQLNEFEEYKAQMKKKDEEQWKKLVYLLENSEYSKLSKEQAEQLRQSCATDMFRPEFRAKGQQLIEASISSLERANEHFQEQQKQTIPPEHLDSWSKFQRLQNMQHGVQQYTQQPKEQPIKASISNKRSIQQTSGDYQDQRESQSKISHMIPPHLQHIFAQTEAMTSAECNSQIDKSLKRMKRMTAD